MPIIIGISILRLLDLDVEMNPRDGTYGFTPLHWFCHGGILLDEDHESDSILDNDSLDVLIFNCMIDKGADLNAQAADGSRTPLHCAARTGMPHLIPAFSSHNANFRARCAKGGTALHWAATGGDITVIDELIQAGLSVIDTDDDNRIPLLWAHPMGRYELDRDQASEVIEYLIATHGSPCDHLDNKRQNTLHLAAAHRQDQAVAFLLETKHIDPKLLDINGMTPLHLAAREHDSNDTVSLILRAQPDVTIHNKLGQTALDLATSEEDQDVVKLIQGYMKNGREATYSKSDIRRYFLPAKL